MQKVSKQSLAMIALSILLAISIALTFTFAVLSDTRTATGTIEFSGNVGLVYDGVADSASITIAVVYDGDDYTAKVGEIEISAIKIKLAKTSVNATIATDLQCSGRNGNIMSAIVSVDQIAGTQKATNAGTALSDIIKFNFSELTAEQTVALSEAEKTANAFTVTFKATKS